MEPHLEALIARYLGPRFQGRRFLRFVEIQQIGIVSNRSTLDDWIERGWFPAGIRLAGPRGKSLVWPVSEIVELIAERAAERGVQPRMMPASKPAPSAG